MAGAIVDNEGVARSIPRNEERVAHAWVNCQERYVGLYGVLLAFGRMDAEE